MSKRSRSEEFASPRQRVADRLRALAIFCETHAKRSAPYFRSIAELAQTMAAASLVERDEVAWCFAIATAARQRAEELSRVRLGTQLEHRDAKV